MHFKTDWASLIVGSKFTVSALFYFAFEGNFPSTSTWGAYIWRGDLTEGILELPAWGLIFLERLIFGFLWYIAKQCNIVTNLKCTYLKEAAH